MCIRDRTKVGATWENYTSSFDAKIVNHCLGVSIRAQDLNNYYMVQIRHDGLRMHRRVSVPILGEAPITQNKKEEKITQFTITGFGVGWQLFDPAIPFKPELEDWFRVRIKVRGESLSIYINGELKHQEESFLKILTGKVGFRNNDVESALVKNVQVKIDV